MNISRYAPAGVFLTLVALAAVAALFGIDLLHAHHGAMLVAEGAAALALPEDAKEALTVVSKQLLEVSDKLTKQAETTMAELKNFGQISGDTKKQVDDLIIEQKKLTDKVSAAEARVVELEQRGARRGGSEREVLQTIGAQIAAHEPLKDWAAKIQAHRGISIPVKNTTTSTGFVPTSAPPIVQPDILPGVLPLLRRRLFARDVLSPGRTGSPAVAWVRVTGFTNASRPVSEGTAKPYSDLTFDAQYTPVRTIAHMFKASKQILDDFVQLQSTVDDELRYGLKFTEEQEFLFGDGTGQHIHGIVPQATAYKHEFSPALMTPIDDIRLAVLQSQLARIPASAVVLHYVDWARIELTKDSQGRYIIGNPQQNLLPTIWGLPVVATEIPAFVGKLLTGPFLGGAQIFDREDMNVVLSTENADDFEKNLISVRCEERTTLAVKRPEGFIYGAMTVST